MLWLDFMIVIPALYALVIKILRITHTFWYSNSILVDDHQLVRALSDGHGGARGAEGARLRLSHQCRARNGVFNVEGQIFSYFQGVKCASFLIDHKPSIMNNLCTLTRIIMFRERNHNCKTIECCFFLLRLVRDYRNWLSFNNYFM